MTFWNNQKGISMIMLVITIIMLAIIISFAVFSSQNVAPEAKLAAAYSSLKTIKDACDNAINLIDTNPSEYDEYYFFGKNIQSSLSASELQEILTKCGLTSSTEISDRTYLIQKTKEEEDIKKLERLELKNIPSSYVVDLENKNYYIVNGTERVNGEKVYEYKEILKSYQLLVE